MVATFAGTLFLAVAVAQAGLPTTAQASPHGWQFEIGPLVPRGRLGVTLQPMTEELRGYFGAPADRGVLITKVVAETPAEGAGLRAGDVVLSIDGIAVARPRDLIREIATAARDAEVVLEILRERQTSEVAVVVAGEPSLYFDPLDPESWHGLRDRMDEYIDKGQGELMRRLEELERRLKELERSAEESPGGSSDRI